MKRSDVLVVPVCGLCLAGLYKISHDRNISTLGSYEYVLLNTMLSIISNCYKANNLRLRAHLWSLKHP